MNGFLMMMTQNGKLLYISDNAAEYLGHSMVSRHFFYFSILSAFYLSEWKSKRTVGTNEPVPRAVSWRVFFDYLNILSSFPPPPFPCLVIDSLEILAPFNSWTHFSIKKQVTLWDDDVFCLFYLSRPVEERKKMDETRSSSISLYLHPHFQQF